MEGSRIDLKTFLGLANPNQYMAPKVPESKYQAGFGVIISGQNPQTFMIPIYSTTVLYDFVTHMYIPVHPINLSAYDITCSRRPSIIHYEFKSFPQIVYGDSINVLHHPWCHSKSMHDIV